MPILNDNFKEIKRNVDIVFCIDATGSMSNIINDVKENAKRFHKDLANALVKANSSVESLRVKVIAFRDYECDEEPMVISSFFELPSDVTDFESCVNKIEADGGGDNSENGLEALYYAMTSDFYDGPKDRQVIIMFTDADALALKKREKCKDYPSDMVDMKGLEEIWSCIGQGKYKLKDKLKRLIIYAPVDTIYEKKLKNWNRTTYVPVESDEGLKDLDFSTVIKEIVASVTSI